MLRKLRRCFVLLLFVLGIITSQNSVFARDFYDNRHKLTGNVYVVGSIEADLKNGMLVNATNARIYFDGVGGLRLVEQNIVLEPYSTGYKLKYRGYASGNVNAGLKGEFSSAGFSIGASLEGNIHVSKYIKGEIVIKVPYPKNECYGNVCKWEFNPILETE